MFKWFKSKKKITLLNNKWEIINPLVEVDEVPRDGDYIYLEELGYFKVLYIVHYILGKQGIFLVLEKFNIKDQK